MELRNPGTLLYTSDAISLKNGYQTYTVTDIGGVDLPDKVTWTVEFSTGSTAGLVLGGTDVVGSSLNDFWQKDAAGWTLYQSALLMQLQKFYILPLMILTLQLPVCN